jgi:sugar-phosphatase
VISNCGGILFDLDGVLVDSTGAVARVWRRWAQARGLPPERVIREAHGRRSVETIQVLASELDAARENQLVEAMEIADQEGVVALPGAHRLLRSLPQKKSAIVTSATRALAVARMRHAGLPLPEYLVSADDVGEGKPSPQPYLQGAALLELAPAECLVFEDAPAGIESARRAGMRVIALTTTFPKQELAAADAIVNSLADVRVETTPDHIKIELTHSRRDDQES